MTNSYSGNPADNPVDAVRFWISDRGPAEWQVSNEEIEYVLTLYPNSISAAAAIANELAMKWALACDKAVGDFKLAYSQRSKFYAEMADRLKDQADQNGVTLSVGGACPTGSMPFSLYQFDIAGACGPAAPPCGVCGGPSGGGCGCGG